MGSISAGQLAELFVARDQTASGSLVLVRRQARWVVPLDSRRVAAAGLAIYRPKSLAETVAWYGARCAIAPLLLRRLSGQGVGLRNQLAEGLRRCLGRQDLRFAVATPQADRATVAAIAPSGRLVAFGKLAGSDQAARRVEREHAALTMIRTRLQPQLVEAPEVLFRGELEGVDVLLISPVGGRPAGGATRLGRGHLRALASLVQPAGERPLSALLPAMGPLDERRVSETTEASERVARWHDIPVRPALVHGDFAPWNVVTRRAGVAAYDWEDASPEGAPFWDLWHFVIQEMALLGRGRVAEVVAAAVRQRGRLGRAVAWYAAAAKVPRELAVPVLAAYLASAELVVGRHGDLHRPDRMHGLRVRAVALERLLEAWS